jgi:hydroxyacylglutathione hydrolase
MLQEIEIINLGFVNCYLIKTNDGFILVDSGMLNNLSDLEKVLTEAGCKPGNLRLIIFTHGDIDHTSNGAYLREKYQTRLAMHPGDATMVENGAMRPKRKVKSLFLRIMHLLMRISGGTNKMVAEFDRFKPDLTLEEGQSLEAYGFDGTVLHLPGHTKGSIGILTSHGELLSGDLLENRGGPHPTMIVDDEIELAASLERLSKLGITTVFPGHGKPFPWEQYVKQYLKKNRGDRPFAPSESNGRSAMGVSVAILGVICGLSGFEHGFFELLQGNVAAKGQNIYAIGEANRFWSHGTEPAFTIVPNFLITGILAMTVSLLLIFCATWFVQRNRYGGPILMLLSIVQYLVGGGIPAPFLALVMGVAAIWINRPLTWRWAILPAGARRVLAAPWLWLVIALSLVFCTTIVGAIFGVLPGVTDPNKVTNLLLELLYAMEGLLPLMVISILAHDSLMQTDRPRS